MKLKKGDTVQVITGPYKGTVAEITKVFPSDDKVIVEGVNIAKKHLKPSQDNPDGGIIDIEMPIHVSNVMAYDSKAKVASKISYELDSEGKKVRIFKKTGTPVDKKKKGAK